MAAPSLSASGSSTSWNFSLDPIARPPDTISLATIINAIDAALPARPAAQMADSSPVVKAVRSIWKEIQTEEQRLLEECTLAELIRRAQTAGAYSYHI